MERLPERTVVSGSAIKSPNTCRDRAGTVHVWRCDLSRADCSIGVLDAADRRRLAGFLDARHARQYALSRAALRHVLSSYVGVAPERLRFATSDSGKPSLQDTGGGPPVSFNLSHSGNWALVAVGGGQEIGVDLQEDGPVPDLEQLARRVMSPGEWHVFREHDEPRAAYSAFLDLWTRKEAILKAFGCGLLRDPRTIHLGLDGRRPRTVTAAGHNWTVTPLSVSRRFHAAVASRGSLLHVIPLEWPAAGPASPDATRQAPSL